MKHNIKHISIPHPCTQNWGTMDIVEQGRFCQSCQKTVTDFTRLSNEQILNVLSSAGKVCGRFEDTQLKQLNAIIAIEPPVERFSWKKLSLAAAVFIGFWSFIKTEAKAKPPIENHPLSFKEPLNVAPDTVKEFRVITGSVTDSLGQALPGVTVRIKGAQFRTSTDPEGNFQLRIPVSAQLTGQVLYIGFITQEFKIDDQKAKYSFVLKGVSTTMGEVMILPVKKPKPVQKKQD